MTVTVDRPGRQSVAATKPASTAQVTDAPLVRDRRPRLGDRRRHLLGRGRELHRPRHQRGPRGLQREHRLGRRHELARHRHGRQRRVRRAGRALLRVRRRVLGQHDDPRRRRRGGVGDDDRAAVAAAATPGAGPAPARASSHEHGARRRASTSPSTPRSLDSPHGGAVDHRWDLNGDGIFERDTGRPCGGDHLRPARHLCRRAAGRLPRRHDVDLPRHDDGQWSRGRRLRRLLPHRLPVPHGAERRRRLPAHAAFRRGRCRRRLPASVARRHVRGRRRAARQRPGLLSRTRSRRT